MVLNNIEWWGPIPASNYTKGRQGKPISMIVDHWVGRGDKYSADASFKNPHRAGSAHFLVDREGRVIQWVPLEDTAWHSNNWNTNLISIGIEHEDVPNEEDGMWPTDAMYKASAQLHAHLSEHYGFPLITGKTVMPHNAFAATRCPGDLDLDRIVREAKETDMTKEETKALIRAMLESPEGTLKVRAAMIRPSSDAPDPFIEGQFKDSETATRKWIVGL